MDVIKILYILPKKHKIINTLCENLVIVKTNLLVKQFINIFIYNKLIKYNLIILPAMTQIVS